MHLIWTWSQFSLLNYWLQFNITLFPKIKLTNFLTNITSDSPSMHNKYEDLLSYVKNQHSTSFKHLFIKHQRWSDQTGYCNRTKLLHKMWIRSFIILLWHNNRYNYYVSRIIHDLHKAKSTLLSLHNTKQFILFVSGLFLVIRGSNLNGKDNQLNFLPTWHARCIMRFLTWD